MLQPQRYPGSAPFSRKFDLPLSRPMSPDRTTAQQLQQGDTAPVAPQHSQQSVSTAAEPAEQDAAAPGQSSSAAGVFADTSSDAVIATDAAGLSDIGPTGEPQHGAPVTHTWAPATHASVAGSALSSAAHSKVHSMDMYEHPLHAAAAQQRRQAHPSSKWSGQDCSTWQYINRQGRQSHVLIDRKVIPAHLHICLHTCTAKLALSCRTG